MDILWRIASKLYKGSGGGLSRKLARGFEVVSMSVCSHAISAQADVGEGTVFFHHGLGTVVHERAVIGADCLIFQNVTIGEKHSKKNEDHGVPTIGNNVTIGAGAVLLGGIYIGDGATIGANAVVIKDVSSNDIVCGVPGKSVLQ